MSVWQHCPRSLAMRVLELIILQFLVMVIMPNTEVGTAELPAVGAKKVACSAESSSISPCTGEPLAPLALLGDDSLMMYVGDHFQVVSRHAAISAADVLQLSRRLRI